MPVSLITNFVRDSIKETAGAIDDVLDAVSGVESDARDFVYDDRQGRNIAVDVRGITEALRSIYHADELLRELRGR